MFSIFAQKRKQSIEAMNYVPDSVRAAYAASSSDEVWEQWLPSTGNVRVITILMQFPDLEFHDQGTIVADVQEKLNSEDALQYGSVNEYFKEASYGELDMAFDVVGPFTAEENIAYYQEKNNGNYRVDK